MASIVFCGSMALAAAVVAAGGPQPSSESSFSALGASAIVSATKTGPPNQTGFSIFVSRSIQSFDSGSSNGPGKAIKTTTLFLSIDSGTSVSSGCFEIAAKDFNVGENLQSASLQTTLTTSTPQCKGKGGPVGPKPGAAPLAGGGVPPPPVVVPLPLPITLNVTWVGNGIVGRSHDSHSFECLDYSTQFTGSVRQTIANASGTVSAVPGSFNTTSANVTSDESHQETSGTIPVGCVPTFGG